MIIAIVSHAFRRASDCLHRGAGQRPGVVPAPPHDLRRLPLRVHIWGVFLPPWPNYGVSRMKTLRRPSRKTPG